MERLNETQRAGGPVLRHRSRARPRVAVNLSSLVTSRSCRRGLRADRAPETRQVPVSRGLCRGAQQAAARNSKLSHLISWIYGGESSGPQSATRTLSCRCQPRTADQGVPDRTAEPDSRLPGCRGARRSLRQRCGGGSPGQDRRLLRGPARRGPGSRSAASRQLANPRPKDSSVTGQLDAYRNLAPRWTDWGEVRSVCGQLAAEMLETEV